jgi:hypothetical protein
MHHWELVTPSEKKMEVVAEKLEKEQVSWI